MDDRFTGKQLAVIATALAFQIVDTLNDEQIDNLVYFLSSLVSQIEIVKEVGIAPEDRIQPLR